MREGSEPVEARLQLDGSSAVLQMWPGDPISISSARVNAAPSTCSQPLEEPALLCLAALRHPSELLTWCKSASHR